MPPPAVPPPSAPQPPSAPPPPPLPPHTPLWLAVAPTPGYATEADCLRADGTVASYANGEYSEAFSGTWEEAAHLCAQHRDVCVGLQDWTADGVWF